MSNSESFCTWRIAATAGSTVRSSASVDDVSSFSTAVMNLLLARSDLAKTTLRSGTEPFSSPPCLNRAATPSFRCAAAAVSARSHLAFLSATSSTLARDGGGGMTSTSLPPSAAPLLPRTARELASAMGLRPPPDIGVPDIGAPVGVGIIAPPPP